MRTSVASLSYKLVAVCAAFALACSMVPLAWADDGSAATAAGIAAGNAEAASAPEDAIEPDDAPEASAQSADAKAAGSSAGPGTTVSIQVYRSSYPLVWDLNDEGSADETKASWASKPAAWPTEGSPGSAVGTCDGYVPWTDDANPGSEPSRLGFNFMGWSTEPDIAVEGTGKLDTLVLPKDAPIVEGDDGVKRITLYALWAPVEYSVVFDLTKNPEDASAVPSFSWTTGKGAFSDLGGGRYRLSGVTLEDYDPATGLIEIATPARGTGGYRFLSWAEPESQQDPAVAVMKAGSAKWFVNPVALPHYSYEPVLTARWALSFDVDVPSQVTFDQYDSLEVEGSLTDTTEKDAIDEESTDPHDAGKLAHFCSQSTACDYKIVALKSVRQPTADDVLTTSDSSKATHDEVLGGERLLSLFAAGATSESQGVHFKLDDAIDMDDSTRYGAFTIPKQTRSYADSDHSRDDENRLYVSYRLNLSNLVDGASEPNHGLVVAKNVNEGDRTPIAEVSYEFAVADSDTVLKEILPSKGQEGASEEPSLLYVDISDAFLLKHGLFDTVQAGTYNLADIQAAANDLSAKGTASPFYPLYRALLIDQVPFKAKMADGTYVDMHVLGIGQDSKASGATAGLTFQSMEHVAISAINTNPNHASTQGWTVQPLRTSLQTYFDPVLTKSFAAVTKYQQRGGTAAYAGLDQETDAVFLPSLYEVLGTIIDGYNNNEASLPGAHKFQYQYFQQGGSGTTNEYARKSLFWWTRSCQQAANHNYCCIDGASANWKGAGVTMGINPCFAL